jgi:T-complex protein 1 subunit theta
MRFLKEGSKHYQGLDEAVLRNIEACTELVNTIKSGYGPNGMNKMVINHLEKLFVTSDAATIIRELEVQHPAAKMLILASQTLEQEVGDGTNGIMIFGAALLENADELLRMGLKPTEIAEGYELAGKKALEILPELVCGTVDDLRNPETLAKAIRPAIMSKQFGNEDFLSKLVADACIRVMPKNDKNFNVDNVRVAKILGSGVLSSKVMNGMLFKRSAEGEVKKMEKAKIAVYSGPFDLTQTETKGTVLINNAQELLDFSKGEESVVEQQVKALADAGINVVVSGGKFGDLYLHFMNKYKIMGVRLNSKFDVRRLCKTVGATALPKITVPNQQEIGHCDKVYLDEIGETEVVVFHQDNDRSQVSTIVIRGSSDNLMDDIERAIDDAVNNVKALTKDGRVVPGAGAVEIELARQIESYGEVCPGLEQYAIQKFSLALESLPKQLADNAGVKPTEILSKLYAEHQQGKKSAGFDVENGGVLDSVAAGITDLYLTKYWMLKLATNAATTVLKIDQIIMAKPAGGPKTRPPKGQDEGDDD